MIFVFLLIIFILFESVNLIRSSSWCWRIDREGGSTSPGISWRFFGPIVGIAGIRHVLSSKDSRRVRSSMYFFFKSFSVFWQGWGARAWGGCVLVGWLRFYKYAFYHKNPNFHLNAVWIGYMTKCMENSYFDVRRHCCQIYTNHAIQNLRYSKDNCSFVEKKKGSTDVFQYVKKSPDCSGQ